MPITVRVIDSNTVNAFTLPGGYQYLNRGLLLRLEGEAELASVLARGIAHTALRSNTNEATKGEMMQLAMIPLVMLGPVGSSSSGVPLAVPLTMLKARQDSEFDADYFGVQYVYKAGYDPKCFTSFVQLVWGAGTAATQKTPKALSTYPPLDERLAALRNEISEILPLRDGATVSTSEFDAFIVRLRAQKPEGQKQPTLKTEPRNSNLKPSEQVPDFSAAGHLAFSNLHPRWGRNRGYSPLTPSTSAGGITR
jgi:predicted Zn-dependent protease